MAPGVPLESAQFALAHIGQIAQRDAGPFDGKHHLREQPCRRAVAGVSEVYDARRVAERKYFVIRLPIFGGELHPHHLSINLHTRQGWFFEKRKVIFGQSRGTERQAQAPLCGIVAIARVVSKAARAFE